MKSPKNIQDLIALLSKSSKEDYNNVLRSLNLEHINFESFESWSTKKYTRNCIYRDEAFELILLCWEKGHETAIHGHDGEDCWLYMLQGEMEEVFFVTDNYNYLREEHSQKLLPGELSFMNDVLGLHKLRNSYDGRSISLHLYAKPIANCRSFDEASGHFVKTRLHYDTFRQLIVKD